MKCKKIQRLLPGYLEGVLSSEKLNYIDAHLRNCDICRKEVRALEHTIRIASSLPVEYPPPEVWEAFIPVLRRRIAQQAEKQFRIKIFFPRLSPLRLAGTGVAALLLIGFLSLAGYFSLRDSTHPVVVPSVEVALSTMLIDDAQVDQLEQIDTTILTIDAPVSYGYVIADADVIEMEVEITPKIKGEFTDLVSNLIKNVGITDLNQFEDDELMDAIACFDSNY